MSQEFPAAGAGPNCFRLKSRAGVRVFLTALPGLLLLTLLSCCLTAVASARQMPVLSVKPASVAEGDAGVTNAAVTVELSAASSQTVTAQYRTNGLTATAGADFQPVTGSLTFSPGVTQQTVNVPVVGDTIDEEDEYLFVQITGATGASVSVSSNPPLLTILDDDATPRDVRLSASAYSFDEGAGLAVVTVNRTGDLSATSSVNYETRDGPAVQRSDYLAAYGTLVFGPGESSKQVSIFLTNDRWDEGAGESFSLVISGPVNTAIDGFVTPDASASATIVIRDDDDANGTNPVKAETLDPEFFVRQHYRDFLNRDPDPAGLSFWVNEATSCGAADLLVCRVNVSAAFFLSIEFQETGYLAYLAREASFDTGERLRLRDFLADLPQLSRGVVVGVPGWEAQLEANKQAFYGALVSGAQFRGFFPETMSPAQVIDRMNENAGGVLSQQERDLLVAGLTADNTAQGRARALRRVVEDQDFVRQEKSRAFVLMQYFGYLRRNPNDPPEQTLDFTGYNFWLNNLNNFGGDFVAAEMVKAFITSREYEERFAP